MHTIVIGFIWTRIALFTLKNRVILGSAKKTVSIHHGLESCAFRASFPGNQYIALFSKFSVYWNQITDPSLDVLGCIGRQHAGFHECQGIVISIKILRDEKHKPFE